VCMRDRDYRDVVCVCWWMCVSATDREREQEIKAETTYIERKTDRKNVRIRQRDANN
jgi:hypothetical protein